MVQTPTARGYDEAISVLQASIDRLLRANPLEVSRQEMDSLVGWALALREAHGYLVAR